jgi:hypothetical protein
MIACPPILIDERAQPSAQFYGQFSGQSSPSRGDWGAARTANVYYGATPADGTALPVASRRSYATVTDCLNAAARIGAALDDCER